MKKTALFLVLILVLSVFLFASCDKLPWGKKECDSHVDENADYICDKCEAELKKPDDPADPVDPTPSACQHKDENKNHECDVCRKTVSVCADADKNHKCDTCDTAMGEHKVVENGHKCAYCGNAITYCTDANNDNVCDVCSGEVEHVSYSLNVSTLEAGKRDNDDIYGRFTIIGGTEVRTRTRKFNGVEYTKSVKMGSDSNGITIEVPGNGVLTFLIQNGSSGKDYQKVLITAPDGSTQEIEFEGQISSSPVVELSVNVTPGIWTIQRTAGGGTIDVYNLDLACVVEKAEECRFELVATGNVDYLVGSNLSTSGLVLNGVYGNGKTEPLSASDYTVDTSKVDMTKAGAYEVSISYKEYAPIKYNVYVYEPASIKLGFDAIEKLAANSAAGNGVYFNHSFKEVYFVGEELNEAGLSVIVVANCGDKSIEVKTNVYSIVGFDSATAGAKTLTISHTYAEGKSVSATATVYVVNPEYAIDNQTYKTKVDADYRDTIGQIVDGYNMFSTIQQALDFLASVKADQQKLIVIEEGYYNEKLEITIPNLTISGVGADKVVIEWDSLYDLRDAGGFAHVTDSTATVAIRDGAVNVTIEGVTISNWYNSLERFNEKLGAGYPEHRALALLVMSDRFVMKNSKLLGYQDTVEFFTGRQYLENVYISGTTDFIFGTNNTTLFKGCQIHSITNGKTDGGYITAFKGSNKGDNDAIVYGAIFYQCKFTADADVVANKNTAIGRCWDKYASVAVIECEIDAHVSTKGFSGSSKNERYVSMNAKPSDPTVKFVEYGNTGAGAITSAVAGMKMLTADEAALYSDFSVIFSKTNGKVNWLDAWDPTSTEVEVDDRTYYYFNGKTGSSGTSYTYSGTLEGTTGTLGDIAIDATSSKVAARTQGDTQINAGATFTFNVTAGTLVTIEFYPGYGNCTINGEQYTGATNAELYYAADTTVVITTTAQSYLYSIIINPAEAAPAA